jgi:hypothetical protein
MNAAEIAMALGAAIRSGQWWRCICPVHGSRTGHSTTLALRDGDRGLIVYCHAGCSTADILAELRGRGLLVDRRGRRGTTLPALDRRDQERRIEIARHIWAAGRDARGSAVAQYLAGRGITIPVPPSLRWVPALRRPDGTHAPAMVARIDNVDGELIGVHRTWIDRGPDGIWRRLDRAMLGCAAGGALRLGAARREVPLVVAEGIESCFGAMQAADLPGWAALSAIGIKRLILPTD